MTKVKAFGVSKSSKRGSDDFFKIQQQRAVRVSGGYEERARARECNGVDTTEYIRDNRSMDNVMSSAGV